MVEISSTAIRSSSVSSERKPSWLIAIYVLFVLVCLNAVRTYENQKRLFLKESEGNDGMEIQNYSAGAEEHVVSQNYGSSMYGGSVHTSRTKSKKHSTSKAKLDNILPKSDGSKDYNNKKGKNRDFHEFSFYVITDTPYTDWQEKRLRSQMADLRDYAKDNPQRNISLGFHLGDTQKVSNSLCAESAYERASYLISKGPAPTFVVPGNNDWYDCPRRDEAFSFFMKHFGPDFVFKWHAEHYENLDIQRPKDNQELFNFYVEGIIFIGVHLIDAPINTESKTLRDERMKASMEWLSTSVETNFARREIRGVVIIGHAGRSERNKLFFSHMAKYFAGISSRQEIPVVYLHGDGLTYEIDQTLSDDLSWDYFHDIQIEQSGLADPVIFDVSSGIHAFRNGDDNDMVTTFGNGLFRLDRRQGRYDNPMDIS